MSTDTHPPQPQMPGSGRLITALGLIAMVSGLLIVLAFQLTAPKIALNKQRALEKAIFTVLPEATVSKNYRLDENGLELLPDEAIAEANVFAGYDAGGKLAGLAMEASARGYQDVVKVLYGYSLERECVIGMTVLQSTETPGLGDKANSDPEFHANFDCLDASLNEAGTAVANPIVTVKNGKKTEPWQIDGISGATVTSTAIGNGLRESTVKMLPLLARFKDSLEMKISQ
jgi:electron transport complex protein RnfG